MPQGTCGIDPLPFAAGTACCPAWPCCFRPPPRSLRHGATSADRVRSAVAADGGGDLQGTAGQCLGVEPAVGGAEAACAAVDDAVEAGRALVTGGGPAEGPADLHVPLAIEDEDVLAQHVAVE